MKKLINWIKGFRTLPATDLEYIYTLNNIKFYQFTSPELIPVRRMLDIQAFAAMTELKFSKETLQEAIDKVIGFIDKGKVVDAAALLKEIRLRTEMLVAEEALMSLAALFFPMEGEVLNPPDAVVMRQKIKMWTADPIAYAFFLQKCIQFTGILTTTLPLNTQNYLAASQAIEDRLIQALK